jgi:anthranilate synthase component 2/para-aminobenzoate synthetase component 2
MVILIDNYDSFTFNIVQALGTLDPALDIRVYRNDQVTVDQIESEKPDHVVISPGPCTPTESGISVDVVKRFAGKVPLLGVCLGHQCIAAAFGGRIVRNRRLLHGKTSMIRHDGRGIFAGLPNPFEATRYHSLVAEPETLPENLEICATCEDGPDEIMAIRHRSLELHGVQFHPESFLTHEGPKLLANFLKIS